MLQAILNCPYTLSRLEQCNSTYTIAIQYGYYYSIDNIEQVNFPLAIKEYITYLLSTRYLPLLAECQLQGRACSLEVRDYLSTTSSQNITIQYIRHLANSLGLNQRDTCRATVLTTSKAAKYKVVFAKLRASSRYLVENISIGKSCTLVFIQLNSLEALKKYSYFAIIDAIYKTIHWGWNLFTIIVYDNYSSWLPTTCFFTKQQIACIIFACLRVIIN